MVSSWFLHGFFHMFEQISTSSNHFQFPTQTLHPWHHGFTPGNHAATRQKLGAVGLGRTHQLPEKQIPKPQKNPRNATWKVPMKNR